MNSKVDLFISKAKKWNEEFELLRELLLDCDLNETIKWGWPCYSYGNKQEGKQESNIVLMHGFKEYCALLFMKGTLLKDSNGILIQQTENVQAARQIRFKNVHEIQELKSILKAYIFEAIEVEKAGLKVEFKKTTAFSMPEEFQRKLDELPSLKTAFEALTPGRQRAYLLHFSQAIQAQTRESRIEKCMSKIFEGKGLNDR